MSSLPTPYFTPEQYLEVDRTTEHRNEYVDGQIYAMSGVSRSHSRVERNVTIGLDNQLRDTSCEVFGGGLRVRPKIGGPYYHPDVTVVCGEAQFEDETFDTLLNPKVVIEILSPSTQSYDRGGKFEMYQLMPSLSEYLLISQDRVRIEHRVLQPDSSWKSSDITVAAGVLELPSIGAKLTMAEVYRGVTFKS